MGKKARTAGSKKQQKQSSTETDIMHGLYVVEDQGMVLLARDVPHEGRTIYIDTVNGDMLRGGHGIMHKNFRNGDDRAENLCYVTLPEAAAAMSRHCQTCSAALVGLHL